MAGWTAPATATAGELTAAFWNAQVRDNLLAINGYVHKSADEPVNLSTTLQDDNALSYTISDTGSYVFDAYLMVSSASNAAGDIRIGFTFPTATCHFMGIGPDVSLASGNISTAHFASAPLATSGVTAIAFGASTTTALIWIHGALGATATGTLTLQWAQQASHADATTVKAGSHMRVWQVA